MFAINSNSVKVVCDGMPYARSGKCMYGAHGSVAPGKNRSLLAAGGSSTIFEHDSSGVLVARHQMGIPGNHTMDFAADTVRGIMFIAGACEQSAGFSAKEVGASGAARVFVASVPRGANKPEGYVPMPTDPPPGSICGSRLALSPDGNVLVLGGRRGPREGIVFIVDPVTGRIGSRAWLGGEVADVIVVRR